MKYLDEFRDPVAAKTLVDQIKRRATRTWTIMEVCGGQTHSIIRNGIDQLDGVGAHALLVRHDAFGRYFAG